MVGVNTNPAYMLRFAHFNKHSFYACFYSAMSPFYHSVCCLMVVRDEDYLHVQRLLEVGPEPGDEGVPVVRRR